MKPVSSRQPRPAQSSGRRHCQLLRQLAAVLPWTAVTIVSVACISSAGAAETAAAGPGMAVNVVRAERRCFDDTLQMSGVVAPRREVLVRPEREGMQISQVLVEPGQNVTSGQSLARLTTPEGQPTPPGASTTATVTAPVAGRIVAASAMIGATASARAEPLFTIAERGEMELVAETPVKTMSRLAIDQSARIEIVGVAELTGRVRHLPTEINQMTQLGQVHILAGSDARLRVGAFGRAIVKLGQRCGPSVPLSAVLYGQGGSSIVQVVRDSRIESREVKVGLFLDENAEIREGLAEGDMVVSRAGAFVRDGDRVRIVRSTE
jgi:HlyD family secretion protein